MAGSSHVVSDYKFPGGNNFTETLDKLRSGSDEVFLDRLKSMERVSGKPYTKLRKLHCALSVLLNERGLVAPAFRPLPTLSSRHVLTEDQALLSLDRIVIDCHYLFHVHLADLKPSKDNYRELFLPGEFNYELAGKFACEKWRAEVKVKELKLPELIQYELGALKSKRVREHMRRVRDSVDDVMQLLIDLADKPQSRFKRNVIDDRLVEYRCLKLAKGSPKRAVHFEELMTGGRIHPDKQRTKLEVYRQRRQWFSKTLKIAF